jgi:aspartate aminotransferase-like enzyme
MMETGRRTLFTPGPTEMDEETARIGMQALPYFRGREFCEHVLAMTEDLKYLFGTATTPLTVTASGTAGMEMALVNLFEPGERVVSIDGGTFGAKWGAMARALGLEVHEVAVPHGRDPDLDRIDEAVTADTRGLLLTAHETSTGYLFDIRGIIAALRNKDCLVVVDAVSSIGADPFAMDAWGCDCAIASSQKALACMPGLVFVAFSERAQRRLAATRQHRSYLDARVYYENIVRGMLPFTPAMHASFQVAHMLRRIRALGLETHLARIAAKAQAFRAEVRAAGFPPFPARASNALSAILLPQGMRARELVRRLEEKHGAILPLNPTGAENFVRVSHMGNLAESSLRELGRRIADECRAMGL